MKYCILLIQSMNMNGLILLKFSFLIRYNEVKLSPNYSNQLARILLQQIPRLVFFSLTV